jgi:hypothetical protein
MACCFLLPELQQRMGTERKKPNNNRQAANYNCHCHCSCHCKLLLLLLLPLPLQLQLLLPLNPRISTPSAQSYTLLNR